MLLSESQRASLTRAAEKYEKSMSPEALGYLESRGLSVPALTHRLGFVSEPEPGHEHMAGRLAFPYWTRAGVVNIKARCIADHDCKARGHAKYSGVGGLGNLIYNVNDFGIDGDMIAIAEGEIDTLSLATAGIPAVGVPGVDAWNRNKHWPLCFSGYKNVLVFADNDTKNPERNPGMDLAKRICATIGVATIVTLPPDEDVNHCLVTYGADFLRDKVGIA